MLWWQKPSGYRQKNTGRQIILGCRKPQTARRGRDTSKYLAGNASVPLIPTHSEGKARSSVPILISTHRGWWWYPHLFSFFSLACGWRGWGLHWPSFVMVEVTIALITFLSHTVDCRPGSVRSLTQQTARATERDGEYYSAAIRSWLWYSNWYISV